MKRKLISMLTVFLLAVVFAPLPAQSAPEFNQAQINQFAKDIMKILDREALVKLMEMPLKLKEAGASYQASFLFPLDKADQYRDDEALRVVSGAYWADAVYAFFFDKMETADQYLSVADHMFQKALDASGCDYEYNRTALMESLMKELENKGTGESIDIVAKYIVQENELIMTCPVGIDSVVDNIHGLVMETVYLSTSIILAMGGDQEVMKTLDMYQEYVGLMDKLLALFESDPDYAVMVEAAERKPLLKAIRDIVKKGNPTLEDVEKLRDIITRERQVFLEMN